MFNKNNNKMSKKINLVILLMLVMAVSIQCKKDDPIVNPPIQGEEDELITTMNLEFIDSAGVLTNQTFSFKDPDGPGGNAPTVFDTIALSANNTYNVAITLLNESVSPAEDITVEVLNEADEHFFCFEPSVAGNCIVTRTDSDGQYEIGLASKWNVLTISQGFMLIKLKHQPGVKNGTCSPGETDIEINFPVKIQ
jgi:hypothetical protein